MSLSKDMLRIEFVDLAKGICIILVVAYHTEVPIQIPGFEIVRMPLYFILSGLFFKPKNGFMSFVIKKCNRLLVPFIFFVIVDFVLGAIFAFKSGDNYQMYNISSLFFGKQPFINAPIWFLISLFWCNIFAYIIFVFVKNRFISIVIVLLLVFLGCTYGSFSLPSPLYVVSSLISLPFFLFGIALKQTNYFTPPSPSRDSRFDWRGVLLFVLLSLISVILSKAQHGGFDLRVNMICTPFVQYPLGAISALALLFFCRIIRYIPVVSYIGRYSIIILCTHYIFIILLYSRNYNCFKEFGIVLLCSVLMIPICRRVIPYFVAQNDLIRNRN